MKRSDPCTEFNKQTKNKKERLHIAIAKSEKI